jgi:hypothetical protein
MKLRSSRNLTTPAGAARAKALTPLPEPAPRSAPLAAPPVRMYSLLLPSAFTRDRR